MKFTKPALSFPDQLAKLKQRGMVVQDDATAIRWLKSVGYYRLSAYFVPFRQPDDSYIPGTNLDTVRAIYGFDRKFRLLLLDAIERVEVALRTAVTYKVAHAVGPFGYIKPAVYQFDKYWDHQRFIDELYDAEKKSQEVFVEHYRKKYTAEQDLPIWMATELLSFGTISRMYAALDPKLRRAIANEYSLTEHYFASWVHTLSYVRNLCAHHSRVWNRILRIRPKLPNASAAFPYDIPTPDRLYTILVIANHLLKTIAPRSPWKQRVLTLFDSYPQVPIASMGIPADWRTRPEWTIPPAVAPPPAAPLVAPAAAAAT